MKRFAIVLFAAVALFGGAVRADVEVEIPDPEIDVDI